MTKHQPVPLQVGGGGGGARILGRPFSGAGRNSLPSTAVLSPSTSGLSPARSGASRHHSILDGMSRFEEGDEEDEEEDGEVTPPCFTRPSQ